MRDRAELKTSMRETNMFMTELISGGNGIMKGEKGLGGAWGEGSI